MNTLDVLFVWWLNSLAGKSSFWDASILFAGRWLVFVLVAGAAIFLLKHWTRRNVALVVAAPALGMIVVRVIRLLYNRARPFDVLDLSSQILNHSAGGSFPSAHATFSFAVAAAIFLCNRRAGILFFILATLISIGRVAGGVHWPSDILIGALLGVISALFVKMTLQKKA